MRMQISVVWMAMAIGCSGGSPSRFAVPLAAFADGARVHVVEAESKKPVHDVQLADDVVDLAWTSDARVVALTRSGAVHLIDAVHKDVARAVTMPPAHAWGSGPTNVRLVQHLEEQKSVKARLAAGEKLEGDYDQQFGSDPYPSMAKLVRVESGDVELVSCQFYAKSSDGNACEDWVWSTLTLAPGALSFGRVSAPGPAYQDPDEHAAPDERKRVRPARRDAPLRAPSTRG
jgi:hypothetical protein